MLKLTDVIVIFYNIIMSQEESVGNIKAEYFRSYGIHSVNDSIGEVHIFSFPNWEDLQAALVNDLPESGAVLTTECATFPGPHEELVDNQELIEERTAFVGEQSSKTAAQIWLGTFATHGTFGQWRNRMLTFEDGEVVMTTDKAFLSGYERMHSPVVAADTGIPRKIRDGRAVLICSEIIGGSFTKFDRTSGEEERTLLVPACWAAVPDVGGRLKVIRDSWIKASGSEDAYFKNTLEESIKWTLTDADGASSALSADTVIVADRNVVGSNIDGPFNAVFRRAST